MARKRPNPNSPPLTAADCLLIDVLAKTDQLFAPYRWNGNPHAPGSIYTRRKRFHTEGIATGGADTDPTSRQATKPDDCPVDRSRNAGSTQAPCPDPRNSPDPDRR